MPRLRQLEGKYAEEDFRREIRQRQGYYDLMTNQALAAHAGMARTTLAKRLSEPDGLTVAELRKLVAAIKPDPLILLGLIGYSQKDIKRLKDAG